MKVYSFFPITDVGLEACSSACAQRW